MNFVLAAFYFVTENPNALPPWRQVTGIFSAWPNSTRVMAAAQLSALYPSFSPHDLHAGDSDLRER